MAWDPNNVTRMAQCLLKVFVNLYCASFVTTAKKQRIYPYAALRRFMEVATQLVDNNVIMGRWNSTSTQS